MTNHTHFEDLLPFYAAGKLVGARLAEIEAHLAGCAECRQDLELWLAISHEVNASDQALTAPKGLAERALKWIQTPGRLNEDNVVRPANIFLHAWQLLRIQALLVRREMWPSSAAVMALGIITALLSKHVEVVYFLAPAVAVASIAQLTGPRHDPAYEMIIASPTSPWKILLARLSVVSAYNLLLSIGATLALLAFVPPALLGTLILGWLGPLAFLSALALLLSLWLGAGNAVAITYVLWIAQYIPYQTIQTWMASDAWGQVVQAYQQFWHSPILLCLLAVVVVGIALLTADRAGLRLAQEAS